MKYFHWENVVCVMGLRKRGKILVPFVLTVISIDSTRISEVDSAVEHKLSSLSN